MIYLQNHDIIFKVNTNSYVSFSYNSYFYKTFKTSTNANLTTFVVKTVKAQILEATHVCVMMVISSKTTEKLVKVRCDVCFLSLLKS